MNENHALLSSDVEGNDLRLSTLLGRIRKIYPLFFWAALLFLSCLIAAVITLAIFYADANDDGGGSAIIIPSNPGNTLSGAYDFPVWPAVEAWDISANHTRTFTASVSTVTWSSVTIAPDGSSMIFDVLGDLYQLALDPATLLPAPAAEARLLLGGVPWARDPRFSPDGSSIAFTYDQSGLDNLWTMDLTTGDLTQLTHENYRWVSAPCYTPDGTQLYANKWLTSSRSLGAGELWVYSAEEQSPLNGGRLVLGISTPDSQLGPEEPVVSGDGKYLYYSRNDNTQDFRYESNVHQTLYKIFERTLSNNSTRTVAAGYGGAARPVLSNDGSTLAFIKRTEFNTSMILLNLTTGNQQVLYTGLDIDMQDSYSPTGNYPSFSFSPSDDYIIVWSDGQFLRLTVATGEATTLDFAPLTISLDLTPSLRFPMSIEDGTSFKTSVVPFTPSVQQQDDQSYTIFWTSTGYTYSANFASDGEQTSTPQRLTTQTTSFEQAPSLSSSSSSSNQFVVQAVWNDSTLGSLELVELSGPATQSTLLTSVPGRYTNPVVSPNNELVVYSVAGASSLTGIQWPLNTGIYVMSLKTKQSVRVRSSGTARWLNENQLGVLTGSTLVTIPIALDADTNAITVGAEAQLATSKYATEILSSSDGSYIAFIEFGWVYVIKTPSGKGPHVVSSRPGFMPSTGVVMCSPDGGTNLQWRGNTLLWLLGANLYQVDMADIQHCWTNGAAAQNSWESPPTAACVEEFTAVFSLSTVQSTASPPTSTLLCLTNAAIVPMLDRANAQVIERGEIQISGEIITAVVDLDVASFNETCASIADATIIDLNGTVILPGFIDAHAHWSSDPSIIVQNSWEQLINLAFGVTTMYNPSADTKLVMADAELARAGLRLGPRISSTGTIIYGAGSSLHQEIGSLDIALSVLRRHQAYGCSSVKSYNQPQRYARQMILEAARQLQMNVVPEGGMMPAWDLTMLVDSHTTIEHNIPVILQEDAILLWNASTTASTPTLLVCYGDLRSETYNYQHENVWEDTRVRMYTPQLTVQAQSMRRIGAADDDYYFFKVARNIKQLADAGVTVEIGAHGQQQGIDYTWELNSFQQGGQTPYQVLFAATHGAANALGFEKIGQIVPGFLADLIVYPAASSPLLDITFARSLTHVVRGGRVFQSPSLTQIFPEQQLAPIPPLQNIPRASA